MTQLYRFRTEIEVSAVATTEEEAKALLKKKLQGVIESDSFAVWKSQRVQSR